MPFLRGPLGRVVHQQTAQSHDDGTDEAEEGASGHVWVGDDRGLHPDERQIDRLSPPPKKKSTRVKERLSEKERRTWTARSSTLREFLGRAVPPKIPSSADATLTELSTIAWPDASWS